MVCRRDRASLPISDVNALPSVQAGISRQCAWPEQRQRATKCREQDVRPRILWLRDEQPALEHNDKQACNRGPEADEQQQGGTYLKSDDRRRGNVELVGEAIDTLDTKSGSGDQPHHQQPRAGYTGGKCPEETSHGNPSSAYGC